LVAVAIQDFIAVVVVVVIVPGILGRRDLLGQNLAIVKIAQVAYFFFQQRAVLNQASPKCGLAHERLGGRGLGHPFVNESQILIEPLAQSQQHVAVLSRSTVWMLDAWAARAGDVAARRAGGRAERFLALAHLSAGAFLNLATAFARARLRRRWIVV